MDAEESIMWSNGCRLFVSAYPQNAAPVGTQDAWVSSEPWLATSRRRRHNVEPRRAAQPRGSGPGPLHQYNIAHFILILYCYERCCICDEQIHYSLPIMQPDARICSHVRPSLAYLYIKSKCFCKKTYPFRGSAHLHLILIFLQQLFSQIKFYTN